MDGLEAQSFGAPPYKPVSPDAMFFAEQEWNGALGQHAVRYLTPFEQESDPRGPVKSNGGRTGHTFAAERASEGTNVFTAAIAHVQALQARGKRVIVAAFTAGARERLATLFAENGFTEARKIESFAEAEALPGSQVGFAVLGVEEGYETPNLAVIGEQDILGDRLVRPRRKARRAADLITEATSLAIGDFVVHADHGIGRFDGLTTITALGAPHDCLEIGYAGGDKLYLPVENIELLSRYGSGDGVAQLDRLGGAAWQSRKARLKQRLREIASELIKIAALRQLREAPVLVPPQVEYDEFVARFPYDETDDQAASIQAVLDDLASGKPMDRLVCGDVGFGKTEVALRAAFIAAYSGLQVAVVVPTTLLARQHFATFTAPLQRTAGAHRPGLPPGQRQGAAGGQGQSRGGHHRHHRRHARAPRQEHHVQSPRPADRRRGAALRRRPQGATEAPARGGARAHPDRHADPAHPATGAVGRTRAVADYHAADRPAGGAHLHLALRSRDRPRGAAARTLSRRPELLCRAAHRRSGGGARSSLPSRRPN